VPIESTGDVQLTKPIYELGVTGVFTKQLDIALLNNEADIAVHSLKDVPTKLADGLALVATLERGAHEDVLLLKRTTLIENNDTEGTIATSSLRRQAQWLSEYKKHKVVPIRGNVQTRLRKFYEDEQMDGVIFAKAGLDRLGLLPDDAVVLDWMLPAPAQGIVGIICRDDDSDMAEACKMINYQPSFIEGSIERQFMRTLMGGCSVPISAFATIQGNEIDFKAAVHAFNGSKSFNIHRVLMLDEWQNAGKESAGKLLALHGAADLVEEIRNKQK